VACGSASRQRCRPCHDVGAPFLPFGWERAAASSRQHEHSRPPDPDELMYLYIRMPTTMHGWVTVVLTVLFVFSAPFLLAIQIGSVAQVSLPPCHHSAPIPNSHDSEHSCCSVGHNRVLLTSKAEPPAVQSESPIDPAVTPHLATAIGSLHTTITDPVPLLRNSSPIRI
jgi:hypothetical protein